MELCNIFLLGFTKPTKEAAFLIISMSKSGNMPTKMKSKTRTKQEKKISMVVAQKSIYS